MGHLRFLVPVLILSLLLTACGTSDPPPAASEVLTAMLAAMEDTAQPLPDGMIRLTAAPAESPHALTETFFSALYGEAARGLLGEGSDAAPPVQDFALFLAVSLYPCELGVFRCADETTAGEVAALCRGRLDTLAKGFAGSEYAVIASGGRVAVSGNWVILALCEDPTPVLEAARRFVG